MPLCALRVRRNPERWPRPIKSNKLRFEEDVAVNLDAGASIGLYSTEADWKPLVSRSEKLECILTLFTGLRVGPSVGKIHE
jgi:hypothetical protein